MNFLILSLLLTWGLYLLYSASFTSPARSCIQAVSVRKVFTMRKRYQFGLDFLASRMIRFIHISEDKRNETQRMLGVLELHDTPEEFSARLLAKTAVLLLIGLLLSFFVSPLLLLLCVVGAGVICFFEMRDLKKKYLQRKAEIELELPKLCSVINSRLKSTSNVQAILETFSPIAGPAMAAELAVTIADMKTGNVETALRRFEGRISSAKVSDVVRGLIAVQNGDDLRVFFQSKQYQFNSDYLSIKKKSISARPAQLTIPGMLLFIFFVIIVMYSLYGGIMGIMNNGLF